MLGIKDFATLCGCSVYTLRYYDQIDLLKPLEVDVHSGYRYYGKEQVSDFQEIKEFQEIGFSVQEIKRVKQLPQQEVAILILDKIEEKKGRTMARHPELLIPASSLEVLKTAVVFGADAVYIGGEAFGLRAVAGGGFGAVLMNGVKRGLFSNEAGSGSAPCAAAAADEKEPVKMGLIQALGVFIDTIVICTCTAMILLLVPQELTNGLVGMDLLQSAMQYHLGTFGTIFIAATLAMFSFSTFIGILFYARSNVAYLFGNKWCYQTAYKIVALVMLFIGGLAAYTTVWDLGDVGVGLMTIFNLIALYPMGGQALNALKKAGK